MMEFTITIWRDGLKREIEIFMEERLLINVIYVASEMLLVGTQTRGHYYPESYLWASHKHLVGHCEKVHAECKV